MKSKRRIRCLCCKKLVMPKINYYEPDEPYSVIPINYQKKHGCVFVYSLMSLICF